MNRILTCGCFMALLFIAACSPSGNPKNPQPGSEVAIRHARGLRIWYTNDGYQVIFRNPQDTAQVYAMLTLSRNAVSQRQADTVYIPVSRAALGSTTFVSYFDRLGQAKAIGSVTYADRVLNANVSELIKQGIIRDITDSNGIDFEQLLAAEPDVFMGYVYGENTFVRYREQGIPVALNMEYMESNPLARAEWILLAGVLTDQLDVAIRVFDEVERNYTQTRNLAAGTSQKPSVFTGTRYGSDWFAPGNKSYIAQFIRDAGATYAFEHVEGQGNAQLDFESVVNTIAYADYWGLLVSSKSDFTLANVLDMEAEYAVLNSVKKGQVFVCNTARTDYFGDAVMQPDVILNDLVAILHPELLPDHVATYFFPVVVDVAF